MAGDWIKMRNDLADDPAVIGMAARLGVDEFSIVGRLHRFWSWADRHSRDGHATGVTKAWIDRYVQCDGFADALETCAWLVVENCGVTIPNFERHNGESAKKRGLATERKRKQRSVTQPSSDASRNERDESVTREEKRREDISPSLRSGDSASDDASTPDPEKPKTRKAQTLAAYLADCKANRVKPVPDDHYIRRWSADAGMSGEMLQIAWVKFRERYTEAEKGKGKRYKDWPAHFATAVKDNWFKLWFADADGVKWTTNGLTCKAVLDAQMKQQEAANAA